MIERQHVLAKRPWASLIAYSRAVRVGNLIEVGGTSSTGADGRVIYPNEAYKQTKYVLGVIADALAEVGSSLRDVVRTRVFLTDIGQWEQVGRAHGEVFLGIDPVSTFVEVPRLMLPGLVVEIEAVALVGESWK